MLYPTINELTKGDFNRYELTLATAKCARIVTDEYVKQREEAEKVQNGNKENDKPISAMINKELRDEKAVRTAIKRLHDGEYVVVRRPEGYVAATAEETEEIEETVDLKKLFADDEGDDGEDNI